MRALLAQLRAIARHLRENLFARDARDAALDEELRAYVDEVADRYERSGLSRDDAYRAALLATGGITQVKEATRDVWLGRRLDAFARELRYALRSLRRSPTFVAIAILTLGLGVGGATAIVSVISAVLLQPLPAVANPGELFSVERVNPNGELDDLSYADYLDFRDRATTIAGLAAYDGTSLAMNSTRSGRAHVWVSYVSDNFFSVLGVHAYAGRVFQSDDVGRYTANPVAVIGYELWKTRFNGDSSVIGSTITLADQPVTIIGVAPQGFVGAMRLHPMEMWLSVITMNAITNTPAENLRTRAYGTVRIIGRRIPSATVGDVRRELTALSDGLARTYRDDRYRGIRVFEGTGMTDDERADIKRTPRLLSIAMVMLLLIACANVAGLSLVRAAAKRRELATRLALGASRTSLIRQLAIEATIIAVLAGIAGIGVSQLLMRTAGIMKTVVAVRGVQLSLDWRTLGAAFAATAAVALLVAVLPALHISRTDVGILMKDGAGGGIRSRSRMQRGLVVAQVAASLVLLASASILFGAFTRTLRIDPGFDPVGVKYIYANLPDGRVDTTLARQFFDEMLVRARSNPRIGSVALTSAAPPSPWLNLRRVFRGEETPSRESLNDPSFAGGSRAYVDAISNDLFAVLRVPFLLGRDFTADEVASRADVAIVSRRLADEMWPHQNPLGRMISWPAPHGPQRPPLRVIGVVADVHHATLAGGPSPVLYITNALRLRMSPLVMYRDRTGAASAALRALLTSMKSEPEVDDVKATNFVDDGMARQRVVSAWIGVFGLIALFLAGIGVYGVIAQSVYQRTRELAVRAAVGAKPSELLRLILADGVRLAVTGTVAGVIGVVVSFRVLRGMFAGMETADLTSAAIAVLALAAATLLASFVPARRAAKLNPVDALRSD
jgi:predicted permease